MTAKPCPFCESDKVQVRFDHQLGYFVRCDECRAQGPTASEAKTAAMLWQVALRGESE